MKEVPTIFSHYHSAFPLLINVSIVTFTTLVVALMVALIASVWSVLSRGNCYLPVAWRDFESGCERKTSLGESLMMINYLIATFHLFLALELLTTRRVH